MQSITADSEESSANMPKTQDFIIQNEARAGENSPDQNEKDVETVNNEDANATQAGVQNIEAVSMTWTTWSLVIAYIGYIS